MHTPEYCSLKGCPSYEILNRISEKDVMFWLAARMHHLRIESGLHVHHISLGCWRRDYGEIQYDLEWDGHISGLCSLTHPSIESMVVGLRETVKQLEEKAAEKRELAAKLLAEAAEMEGEFIKSMK